ncbi:Uncharacterized protein Rs2_04897 [Raphanus sativus]|nr:Uncharacterized protein Rs2_04897 [Raphanus sativus]
MGREGSWVNEWCDMVVSWNQNKICGDLTLLEIFGVLWRRIRIPIALAIKGNKGYDQASLFGFSLWLSMTQGQWITKSGGKLLEGPKPGLRISVPRFDNSGLIASYAKTLIERCMNPPKQVMKMILFMLPRIWGVEGRVVGTYLVLEDSSLLFI